MHNGWSEYFYNKLYEKFGNKLLSSNIELNKNLDWNFFMKNTDIKWSYRTMSLNPNITWDIILENKDKNWDETLLSINLCKNGRDFYEKYNVHNNKYFIQIEEFEDFEYIKYCEKKYGYKINYELLSKNQNITFQDILLNIDKPWNFYYLSSNKNITLDIIKKYNEYNWSINELSRNPNITWNDIINNPQINWYYIYLSINPNITIDIVLENINKPWNYYYLSRNQNITYDIIKKNKDLPWDLKGYSQNPNLMLDELHFLDNTSEILNNICYNNFDKDRNNFYSMLNNN